MSRIYDTISQEDKDDSKLLYGNYNAVATK